MIQAKQQDRPERSESLWVSLNKLRWLFNRREKISFLILLAMMFVGAALETFSIGMIPAFVGLAVSPDKVMQYEPAAAVLEFFDITTSKDLIVWGSLALMVVFLVKNAYTCVQSYFQIRFTQHRALRLKRRLFVAYMHAPYEFHLSRNTAELLRNTQGEGGRIVSQVLAPFLQLTMKSLMIIGMIVLLFVAQPLMAALALTVIGVAGVGYEFAFKEWLRRWSREALDLRKEMTKAVYQGLGAIKEARVLRRESNFVDTLLHSVKRTIKISRYRGLTGRLTAPYMESVAIVTLLGVAIIMVTGGKNIETVAPTLALFAAALARVRTGILVVVQQVQRVRYGVASIDPVYNDLRLLEPSAEAVREKRRRDWEAKRLHITHELALSGVCYHYPNSESFALHDISLRVPRGHSVAFVGPTGAGKTTVVDVILGLLEPQEGTITVDGTSIFDDLAAWQRNIGYIPQFIYLTDDTIRHNVALGIPEKEIDDDQVWKVLEASQMKAFVKTLKDGIHTVVGERGVRLSGGQRQRIGIARALYHNPDVLVMDEATSNLDSGTEKAIVESVNSLKGDRTIIMIAHRLTTVKNCDCLYFMKDGVVEKGGTYEELFENHEPFRAMVG